MARWTAERVGILGTPHGRQPRVTLPRASKRAGQIWTPTLPTSTLVCHRRLAADVQASPRHRPNRATELDRVVEHE
ncbi:hypothetical protein HETIRDRAFT_448224 [Heterobasidion irregulare TC 32-1]|uniref:Uncharacterized protein n=1 Tax=Heterobasidion irregulare (strain TC 32-1) TaxID=747525 RepID=W4KPQ7_HETIT|nr:uncharacterized protein HETIRDRAFT_448224 [Heterobasidion irregulare TC 32-1]ETW87808.1 hypothetical protein HETIRDRAFT_448224 [Heterobasidion irregulare TC 32-1]